MMCNVLLISTEQWIDLALFNCEDISFTQHLPDYIPEIIEMKFEHRWYITGYPNVQSCSCQFRIRPLELGFNPPEDWFCEDEQAIKATKIAYEIFKYLMDNQIQFEIIESWTQGSVNTDINTIHDIDLDFKEISQEEFCFIENSRMLFSREN